MVKKLIKEKKKKKKNILRWKRKMQVDTDLKKEKKDFKN